MCECFAEALNAPPPECRIWLDDREGDYVVVDAEDFAYFSQWRWILSKWGYARRAVATGSRRDGTRSAKSVYLHVEICRRAHGPPPTPAHTLVDHRDAIKPNCRRSNLRWATYSMNVKNRYGQYAADFL